VLRTKLFSPWCNNHTQASMPQHAPPWTPGFYTSYFPCDCLGFSPDDCLLFCEYLLRSPSLLGPSYNFLVPQNSDSGRRMPTIFLKAEDSNFSPTPLNNFNCACPMFFPLAQCLVWVLYPFLLFLPYLNGWQVISTKPIPPSTLASLIHSTLSYLA